ncbi:hypothetical protein [Parasphaerochaeta coccoides]|uniref:Outer membrane protein beta-barrel domain-containing protein n=1 Tax=Parasphaerochaeta coccoides (strain ATCC BAA-1237 / DSM 17374 / SPN1) TaxID=760011 RepID=F4GKA3_PARC1|nr:hypothetical protein [Parasphaerochaeta coccoides]AEC02299.1 hypothetical protein Spico_1078 [Parasphaerochaeta coccoides DSM 17374]
MKNSATKERIGMGKWKLMLFLAISFMVSSLPVSAAWDGIQTLSIRWGHTSLDLNEASPAYSTGIFIGLGASLNPYMEINVTGAMEATPRPASTGFLSAELSFALLGPVYRSGDYGGSGLNSFVSLALVATPYGESQKLSPNYLVLSFTPIAIGNAMQGKRENLLKFGLAWDFRAFADGRGARFSMLWSLFSVDSYLIGTWSDRDIRKQIVD